MGQSHLYPTITIIIIIIITTNRPLSTDGLHHHSYLQSDSKLTGAYRISPKPCQLDTRAGTCMFVWECIKSKGKHIGMCADGFMFGSCCSLPSSDENTIDTGDDDHENTGHKDSNTSVTSVIPSTSIPITPIPIAPPKTEPPTTIVNHIGYESHASEEILPFITSNSSYLPSAERPPVVQSTTVGLSVIETHQVTVTTPSTTTFQPSTKTTEPSPVTLKAEVEVELHTTTPIPSTDEVIDFCGKAPLFPQMRIVGGKQSSLGQFPWIASIRRTSFFGFSSTHRCGGALLNSGWVATAGHCVDDLLQSQIRVRLGEWDFSGTDDKYPHFETTVSRKVVHPSYNFFTYENDLALLKLDKPIEFSRYIRPICLPGNQDLLIGENATVAGWGRLSENGQLPSRLQHVTVPIISNERCRELFLKSNRVEHIPDIFLCAGYEQGGQGPLQVKGRDGRYFLGGIISWGIGCAEKNMPGVCTRISKFTDWILSNVT